MAHVTSIRLDDASLARLKELRKATGLNRSELVRQLLAQAQVDHVMMPAIRLPAPATGGARPVFIREGEKR